MRRNASYLTHKLGYCKSTKTEQLQEILRFSSCFCYSLSWLQKVIQVKNVAETFWSFWKLNLVASDISVKSVFSTRWRILPSRNVVSAVKHCNISFRVFPQSKAVHGWSFETTSTWRNIPSVSDETACGCLRKQNRTRIKFCSKSGTVRCALLSEWPWNLAAPLRIHCTLPYGWTTGWCGKYHSRSWSVLEQGDFSISTM